MSASLRIVLIVCSIVMLIYVAAKIRRAQMRIGDGIIWLGMSIVFIIISVFPEIVYWMCSRLGMMSPSNLVYLVVIAFLLMQIFYNSVKISNLSGRIDALAQEVALRDERFMKLKTTDSKLIEQSDKIKKSMHLPN